MTIEYVNLEDIALFNKFAEGGEEQNLKDVIKFIKVVDGERVIAFAYVKHFIELFFVPDPLASVRLKVEALKALDEEIERDMRDNNVGEVNAFVQSPTYALILRKHFNYFPIKGIGLVKRVV